LKGDKLIIYDYHKITRLLEKMPQDLKTAIELRDWLKANYATESCQRILQQLNACYVWADASDMVDGNPFNGLSKQFCKVTNHENLWTSFTTEERNAIIKRFESENSYYTPWVKFLFWTGCRPSEAFALKWEHIKPDLSEIHFVTARPVETKISKRPKTKKDRFFPCNDRLKKLLKQQRNENTTRNAIVFPSVEGKHMEYHNFQTRHWKPTIEALVEEEKVFRSMSQYHCRHTWITLALKAGMKVEDVAYFSGNSPVIIYKHYTNRSRQKEIPEC
jgi:integrase